MNDKTIWHNRLFNDPNLDWSASNLTVKCHYLTENGTSSYKTHRMVGNSVNNVIAREPNNKSSSSTVRKWSWTIGIHYQSTGDNVCHGVLMYRLILKMFEINSYINILTKRYIVKKYINMLHIFLKYLFWCIYKIIVNVYNDYNERNFYCKTKILIRFLF